MGLMHTEKKKKDAYILITGASSGIGKEFAIQLARKGYPLILVARREERLKQLESQLRLSYGARCLVWKADLSSEKACRRLFERLEPYRLGMLINNAGFGSCGTFIKSEPERDMEMIDVNIRAMHILMRLALEKLKKQNYADILDCISDDEETAGRCQERSADVYDNCILNVASSAGLLPGGPYMATYYATKAYIASLSQAVAEEERQLGSGIHVSCLCPGPVDTEFNEKAQVRFALKGISPEHCVRSALSGVRRRKTVIVPGVTMKLAVFGSRFLPRSVLNRITSHQQKKKIYR